MDRVLSVDRTRVDLVAECIWRDGERVSVPPKAFSVLRHLIERPEQLVTKAQLLDAVWPETHVIDAVVYIAVRELRQALGDDPKAPRFIDTVHRRGFRWIGPPAAAGPSPIDDDIGTFVGRSQPLAELEGCFARANAGRRQLVFVTGEPGIGKTTLIERFVGSHDLDTGKRAIVAFGRCVDGYGVAEVYRPLLDAVAELLRAGGDAMVALFRKHAPTWLLPLRAILTGDDLEALQSNTPTSSIEGMQRELESALEAASSERTVILVLEDLHWSDPNTIALMGGLATRRTPARLLMVGTYRPYDAIAARHPIIRLRHELISKRQCSELALDGLSGEAIGEFLDQRFVSHRLPASLATHLQAHTSGNPLFLLNALADLEQRGWLYQRDGSWECSVDSDTLASTIPDGSRELIAFRLDLLPTATVEMLEAASLVGMSFTTQAVAAATERSAAEIESECRRLTHTLFLRAGDEVEWPDGSRGQQYTFRHSLYRQVLNSRVSPSRRQATHRRIADRMDRGYGKRLAEIAAPLSFHYERAGDAFRAVELIEILVQQTHARRAVDEAMMLYDRAVTLLQRLPESEAQQSRLLQIHAALGMSASTTVGFGHDVSKRAIEGARVLSASLPSPSENMALLGAVFAGHLVAGELRQGQQVGEQILAAEGDDAPPETLLAAHTAAGISSFYLGELDTALRHLESAAAIAASVAPVANDDGSLLSTYDPGVPGLSTLAQALTLAGRAEQGSAAIATALARARQIEMPWYEAYVLAGGCVTGVYRRDLAVVRRYANELQDHCGEGQPIMQATARFMLLWAEAIETREVALVASLRQGLEETVPESNRAVLPRNFSMLAEAYLQAGQWEQATAALDEGFERRGEARYYDVELNRQRAALMVARSKGKRPRPADRKEAEELLETAIDLAIRQGTHLFGLRAAVDLYRLPLNTEHRRKARRQLVHALARLPGGLEDIDRREARQLLDDI